MTQLRSLAIRYSQDRLSRSEYRKARRQYVRKMVSGQLPLEKNEYPGLMPGHTQTKKSQTPSKPAPSSNQAMDGGVRTRAFSLKKVLPYVGAVGLLVLIAVIVTLFSENNDDGVEQQRQVADAPVQQAEHVLAVAPPPSFSGVDRQVLAFLAVNDWSPDAVHTFLQVWVQSRNAEGLPAPVLSKATIEKFRLALRKQVMDQKTLASIGKRDEAVTQQQNLIEFAKKVGIHTSDLETHLIQ
ncbi:MAG: hypothetical protein ACYYK0_04345 [Candidatus Eutrophobiaceae bacterium]